LTSPADDEALTPEQMAALEGFDPAVNAASDPEVRWCRLDGDGALSEGVLFRR